LQEINVPVAIFVIQISSFCTVKYNGEGIIESQVVLNATRNILFCLVDDWFGGLILLVKVVR